jgi:hypothetical protein
MYQNTTEINSLKVVCKEEANNEYLAFFKKSMVVMDNGEVVNKDSVEYIIPNFHKVLGSRLELVNANIMFQKWALKTNIPFWNAFDKGNTENLIVLQDFTGSGKSFVKSFGKVLQLCEWVSMLGAEFLFHTPKHILYIVSKAEGFTYCYDAYLLDSDEVAIDKYDKEVVVNRSDGDTFKIAVEEDTQLVKIGFRKEGHSYINLIQD